MPDPKLVDFVRTANLAEAKVRMAKLQERVKFVATAQYVRCLVEMGHAAGYDLTKGDVALIHPNDCPPAVKPQQNVDPVFVLVHPEVIEGKILFVRDRVKYRYLNAGKVVH